MARRARRPGNLPAESTSFVGRKGELADLRKALAETRLLSLVGPGGVGKTRLALRLAADAARAFADGAWLVELAEVQDPGLVLSAVLAALDLRQQGTVTAQEVLLDYLRDRELLVVLDNCEHVLEASVRLVAEMIRAAPGLKLVATSRAPLVLTGEQVVPVAPLDPYDEAVILFCERAGAAGGGFELTHASREVITDICRRLDGLPLAIELAAGRTRVLTPEQILQRLDDRFALLTGGSRAALPRHQTLRTAIDWSHDLLTEAERRLLRQLSVFAGSFDLADVESVFAAPALDELASLLDKSLVAREAGARVARYRLHETMREYAREKLLEVGEDGATYERYVDHYVSTCAQAADGGNTELVWWLEWMESEIENIRSVLLRCSATGDLARGAALAGSMRWYWITRATTEGARWLDEFLAQGSDDAQAWCTRGDIANLQNDVAVAVASLSQAVALARASGRRRLLVQSLAMLSVAGDFSGDPHAADGPLAESFAEAEALGDDVATIAAVQARSHHAFIEWDMEMVRTQSTRFASIARRTGNLFSLEYGLIHLGMAQMVLGDLAQAKTTLEESLRIARQLDDRMGQVFVLAIMARLTPDARLSGQLLGAAETIRAGAGATVSVTLAPLLAQVQEQGEGSLGVAGFAAEVEAGRGLSRQAAIALALGEAIKQERLVRREEGPLGKREAEVARLVAEGLSNKEIGTRLFISERDRRKPRAQCAEQARLQLSDADRELGRVHDQFAHCEVLGAAAVTLALLFFWLRSSALR